MMGVLLATLAAALLAAGPAAASGGRYVAPGSGAPGTVPLVLQAEHQNVTATLDQGGAKAFVYNPQTLVGAARTAAVKTFNGSGSSSSRMANQFSALSGYGISQTYFELAPCANRAPHTHPFASGLLFVVEANALEVGFVVEDASEAVINNVTTGASAIFPQGLLHYQQNRDCKNTAKFTISYNSDDPQTVNQAIALFKLPTEIIAAAMNVTPAEAAGVVEAAPTKNIYPGAIAIDNTCAQACAAAGTPVVTDDAATAYGLPTSNDTQSATTVLATSDAAPAPQAGARGEAGSSSILLAAAAASLTLLAEGA